MLTLTNHMSHSMYRLETELAQLYRLDSVQEGSGEDIEAGLIEMVDEPVAPVNESAEGGPEPEEKKEETTNLLAV